MEFFGKVFEIVKNIGEGLEIVKPITEWYGYHSGLEESMQNLKRKIEYLSAQENDINIQISSAEHQPWKKPKTEVKIWLRDEQEMKNDVQRLEQEVVGERNLFSRVRLGKCIIEKIQKVEKLQEKGRAFDGLLVDDLPIGELSMPPTKDFVESTEARNVERVWECLMNEDVRQIGVYGMGGVGKTTIMKHIHNLILKETDKFDKVYWVTISKAFNVPKLQSDIAGALNLCLSNDEDETIRARELYAALSRKKKYVLILDDLWEAFPLERVGIPEPTQINGCRILLTTRSLDVCRRMDCTAVKVELLTEQEALTLFLRKAVRNDVVLAPDVKEIAVEIAKECAGLPLAIVIVAGSLRGLEGIHEWRDALNEFTNLMNEVSGGENEVFEQLKFSYSRLGDKVVQDCFLYCSLYPEDHVIMVDELIELWIVEGLIPEMNSVEAMVDKCRSIVGKLKSTCLLEATIDDDDERVWMHDLIRDMAFRITGGRYRHMAKGEKGLYGPPYNDWSEDHERISFMYSWMRKLPNRPLVCPRLTSLLMSRNDFYLIPDSFFTNMPCLKVLDLSCNDKIRSLPESISNLENLHALMLSGCGQLEYVPSMEKLKALKVFILTRSLIKEAPKGIEQLVNLRKLDLSDNWRLETFPSTKLCGLSKLLWLKLDGTRVQVSREDLMCLSQLKVVCVQFHNVQELTMYVTSQQFHGLEDYRLGVVETTEKKMYWIPDSFITTMPCLKVLDLSGNKIRSLPESISNLENLHALILSGCVQLEYVPSMEKLKALKVFILTRSLIKEAPKGIEQLVNLIKLDLSNNRRLETFPSTKLCGLSKLLWLTIDGTRVQVSREDLMCLSQLKVVCVQFHNVQELTMYVKSQQFHGLEEYRLGVGEAIEQGMYSRKLVVIDVESKHFQSGVEQLVLPEDTEEFVLRGSHDLISLSSMPSLKNARGLRKCEVGGCNRLESIFSSSSFSEDGQISLSSVSGLKLFDLPSCRVLFDGISPAHNISFNLTDLSISNCHSMKYILPAQLLQNLPNLETLEVKSCESVEEIIVGEEEMNYSHHRDDSNTITLPRLYLLTVDSLPRLKSLYAGTLVSDCESEFVIDVKDCPVLRRLPLSLHMDNNQATAPPFLEHILGEQEWWESLEWDDPRTKTILQPFFNRERDDEFEDSDSDSNSSVSFGL